MEFEVQKPRVVKEGMHQGVITDVSQRTKPYEYTDVHIKIEDDLIVKASYPSYVCETSKLGMLLVRFGELIVEGATINTDVLKGKECTLVTVKDGNFTNVIDSSVKPR